jgi:hypothetical protein
MDKTVKDLKLETIKMWMVLSNVKALVAELDEPDEIKSILIARLEDAYRTLERFTRIRENKAGKASATPRLKLGEPP